MSVISQLTVIIQYLCVIFTVMYLVYDFYGKYNVNNSIVCTGVLTKRVAHSVAQFLVPYRSTRLANVLFRAYTLFCLADLQ